MSLFALDGVRTASVRTTGPSFLLELRRADFDRLLKRHPTLANEIVRVLGERLNSHENQAIRELTEINLRLRDAYESLKAAQAELVEKEKLEHELALAREIQLSVLPEAPPACVGFEFAACIETARAVGGDFYDFIPLHQDRFGVVVGDVTDKGMPAAIFMAQTYALLHAEASRDALPHRALLRVNQHLLRMNARGLFATILYGILDTHARRFTYARAGHDLPILYTPEGGVSLLPKRDGQPVGILDEPALDQNSVALPPGSTLLLYTDGACDQSNPDGERFGVERLAEAFGGLARQSAGQVCKGLIQALEEHRGGAARYDDVTLVALKSAD
jgi:serine phosphatase RsbU (regulator of sigma subunit)